MIDEEVALAAAESNEHDDVPSYTDGPHDSEDDDNQDDDALLDDGPHDS